MRLPDWLLPFAPIVSIPLACGLNLYATVATLGIGSRTGLLEPLPPELRGLEHTLVIGAALLFLVVEGVFERVPYIDSIWSSIHAFVKPIAAAVLALAIVAPDAPAMRIALALSAGLLALGAHAGRGVFTAAVSEGRSRFHEAALHLLHTASAVGFLVTYQDRPDLALLLAAVIALWVFVLGPRSWRALVLTINAQTARLRGLAGRSHWREAHELPGDLRPLLPERGIASAQPRAIRVGIKGLRGVGKYRNGWLVITPDAHWFLFRTLLGPRRVRIPVVETTRVVPGPWLDAVEMTCEGGTRCTMFLMKDGPHPELAAADLSPTSP